MLSKKKGRIPDQKLLSPMLATLVEKPIDEAGWLYEVKWDGYRALAFCRGDKSTLVSRNGKSFDESFYPVHEAVSAIDKPMVLDGEIVVIDAAGTSKFGALQQWRSEADGELLYYVFDLLWLDGKDLMRLPLSERRKILKRVLPKKGPVRLSETLANAPDQLLAAARRMGLEGIVAKRADSLYKPGERSRDWLKIKTGHRQEMVIGGYTKNEGSPKPFSSLLVGVYTDGKLEYTGKIGTGFNARMQAEMMKGFAPLVVKKSPFRTTPDINTPSRFRPHPPKAVAVWLKPKLVCEVSFTEMTTDGVMRHPSFEGLRMDKAATAVHQEVAMSGAGKTESGLIRLKPAGKRERKSLLNPSEDTQVREVDGHVLTFRNLGKIYWPKDGIAKRDLLNYYYQMGGFMLPYLKGRPQSLNRFPHGISGKSFYQKDVTHTAPDWVHQFPYRTSEGEAKNYLVADDEASLLWMANLGAIEMNPWNSTIDKPDNPDWCIIDLDPTEANTFGQVIRTAQVTRQVLEELQITGYPKTSGSTGIHIYIPMGAKYSYEECQLFGKLIATRVHHRLPEFTSIERLTTHRKGKIYVDYLQNRPKATLAAPYSVRPKPGATVSMPLYWDEIRKGLKMTDYTLRNCIARVKREGDLFKPVLGKGIDLKKVLRRVEATY